MPTIEAYPLAWPAGWPRTTPLDRLRAKFHRTEQVKHTFSDSYYRQKKDIGVYDATRRVLEELKKFGVDANTVIVSTNMELRRDGLPRSDRRAPADPGVAVYWKDPDSGRAQCMAIDLYDSVAGNLAAVAATIDAMRAIERHGGATILNRAFQGFTALPSSTTTALNTSTAADVLARRTGRAAAAITSDREVAKQAYREAASSAHPDAGGSTADFQLIQEAKRVLEVHFGGAL